MSVSVYLCLSVCVCICVLVWVCGCVCVSVYPPPPMTTTMRNDQVNITVLSTRRQGARIHKMGNGWKCYGLSSRLDER